VENFLKNPKQGVKINICIVLLSSPTVQHATVREEVGDAVLHILYFSAKGTYGAEHYSRGHQM
jgi:hypothetical protein